MQTTTKKRTSNDAKKERDGLWTNVFLPNALNKRLAAYMLDRFAGRSHMRNTVILEALEEMLKKEGF